MQKYDIKISKFKGESCRKHINWLQISFQTPYKDECWLLIANFEYKPSGYKCKY